MAYLAHTAHSQLGALWLSCVGWTLTAVAMGLVEWRVWLVSDRQVISSGEAWVGVWRTCFNSHVLVSPGFRVMHCKYISSSEAFTPPEIVVAQVLMLLSLLTGVCGNAAGVYSLRNVYFGIDKTLPIRLWFLSTGVLILLAAVMSLIPVMWNLSSVVTNQTISFPPDFLMPPTPASQRVGSGIWVGMVGTGLMLVSGVVFCLYRLPAGSRPRTRTALRTEVNLDVSSPAPGTDRWGSLQSPGGRLNPVFESDEHM